MSMHINELLNIADHAERDRLLRRGFAPYSEVITVDGAELPSLIVLGNLTIKKELSKDLCDEHQARQLLLDEHYLEHCTNAVRWLHTHNLKYPDSRVSGQRLIIESPALIPGVVSSAGIPMQMGWANNSADINFAKLFCSAFQHGGKITNLAQQLCSSSAPWCDALQQLGLSLSAIETLCQTLITSLPKVDIPDEVSPYSKQVRFPYQGHYCSITPIVSHAAMAKLQSVIHETRCPHTTISHDHPAALGSLVGSVGGKVAVLDYPPPVSFSKERQFSGARLQRLHDGRSLFDNSILYDHVMLDALDHLASQPGTTRKQQRERRLSALRYLRRQLAVWLGPLIEWRDDLEQTGFDVKKLPLDSLEGRLLTQPRALLPELTLELASRFHLTLQHHPVGRRYAFHPELLVPIKSQLLWLLKKLVQPEVEGTNSTPDSFCYLHLSGLRVYDAMAMANPYLCGIPSLSALAGFCHDYERRLTKLLKRPVNFTSVAWYLRDYSKVEGKRLPEPNLPDKAKEISAIRRPGLIDSRYCDVGMDLVIEVQIPAEGSMLLPDEMELLRAAFPARFAGGCLHPPSLYEGKQWCTVYSNPGELFTALSRLPRYGCWVYPFDSNICSLEELVEKLSQDRRLRPVSSGYVLLEEPRQRAGCLEQYHAYAESVIGMALCVNPVEMRMAGKNQFYTKGFWRLTQQNRAILMRGSTNMGQTHGTLQTPKL